MMEYPITRWRGRRKTWLLASAQEDALNIIIYIISIHLLISNCIYMKNISNSVAKAIIGPSKTLLVEELMYGKQ